MTPRLGDLRIDYKVTDDREHGLIGEGTIPWTKLYEGSLLLESIRIVSKEIVEMSKIVLGLMRFIYERFNCDAFRKQFFASDDNVCL